MEEIRLEDIVLTLTNEKEGVRVKYKDRDLILFDQDIKDMTKIIEENFKLVRSHYVTKTSRPLNQGLNSPDINHISVSILLHYMYLYYSWRGAREKQKIEWRFNDKYFDQPSTHDFILEYYLSKYPNDWEERCAALIGVPPNEIKKYFKNRQSSEKK